jgi:hypothetical protein
VFDDASVLASLASLPADCAEALAALDPPDLAGAAVALAAEVKLSRSESLREQDQGDGEEAASPDASGSDRSDRASSSDEEPPVPPSGAAPSTPAAKKAGEPQPSSPSCVGSLGEKLAQLSTVDSAAIDLTTVSPAAKALQPLNAL